MRKFILLGLTVVLFNFQTAALAADNQAIEVEIRGGFAGFDREAYATVRAIMASLVMDGTAEHFITTVRGLDGGGTFCVQFAPLALPRIPSVMAQFQALRVDPISTLYSVREVESCQVPQLTSAN